MTRKKITTMAARGMYDQIGGDSRALRSGRALASAELREMHSTKNACSPDVLHGWQVRERRPCSGAWRDETLDLGAGARCAGPGGFYSASMRDSRARRERSFLRLGARRRWDLIGEGGRRLVRPTGRGKFEGRRTSSRAGRRARRSGESGAASCTDGVPGVCWPGLDDKRLALERID